MKTISIDLSIVKRTCLFCLVLSITINIHSQTDTATSQSKDKIKTGWFPSGVPAISYDSDIGFRYGAVINLFHYGDGSVYPKYLHNLYFEWSRTTKGSGTNQFTYDSEYLIPGIRVSAEASFLTEKALDFYGFDGYESYYNADYEDDESDEYISRVYYRVDRKHTRLRTDFQGKIIGNKLRWLAGFTYMNNDIGTVDIDNLNKGKSADKLLPDTATLFDKYVEWGFIPQDQKDGGSANLIKAGIIYDTRDNEPNPMKGMWTTFQFVLAPSFIGNKDYSFTRMVITHRHYFTIIPIRMNLALRASYQGVISGDMPFYMLPFVYNSAPSMTRDGLGGAKTLRGILRNRIVGEDFLYGNAELRYKVIRTVIWNQNLYIALSGFSDIGMVTSSYDLPDIINSEAQAYLNMGSKEKLHTGIGAGIHFALNENFVVAVDYGVVTNKNDGNDGLYINLNWLY